VDRGPVEPLRARVLTERDKAVLDMEGRFWRHTGTKEAAIRAELGMTQVRYYQALRRLVDDPAALAYAPVTVNRLRRRLAAARR
jgi:hypothetical protein